MLNNKNIIIRVDSGRRIGMGHLIRCCNLAELLVQAGAKITFISKEHDHHLISILSEYSVIRLQPDSDYILTKDSSTWLGDSIEGELKKLTRHLKNRSIDLLIIDHYGIDIQWEKAIKNKFSIKKMMVIDDLHNRKHISDYLVDYTYREGLLDPYREEKLIPESCQTFLGLNYVLLNQLFHQKRKLKKAKSNPYRINISFGGSDLPNLTSQIIKVLIPIYGNHPEYAFDIILGNLYTCRKELEKLTQSCCNINIYQSIDFSKMIELLTRTDLAIGAGGVSVYERCCLGIPSIIITLAKNQEQNARNLTKLGVATHLGNYQNWEKSKLIEEINNRKLSSENCQNLIDGLGCHRIVELLENQS